MQRAGARPIYLDYHATTPLDARVLEAMLPWLREDFGNASSQTHSYGWRAEAAVEESRERLAAAIGAAEPEEIIFTSGATESNNLALCGAFAANARGGAEGSGGTGRGVPGKSGAPEGAGGAAQIVTVATEHPAVLEPCAALAKQGAAVTVLPVNSEGLVSPADIAAAIGEATVLVSVMAANGEIGALQPLAEIGRIAAERDVLFHCDAAQAVGKIPLDVQALGIDLLSFSAHKLYGPKGIGALYIRRRRRNGRRLRVAPLLHGGGQQRGLRPGTLPTPLCVGFAHAAELACAERPAEAQRLTELRALFESTLRAALPGVQIERNGPPPGPYRLPGNLNLGIEGAPADALIPRLKDLALSTGSACSSATPAPSPVLQACGHPKPRIHRALRLALGRPTTEQEALTAAQRLAEEAAKLRVAE